MVNNCVILVLINNYLKNPLQCYNHLTVADVVHVHQTMKIVLFTEGIGPQIAISLISHTHRIHSAIHITAMPTIRLMVAIHRITHHTRTCIKTKKEFMRVRIHVIEIQIHVTLVIVKGKSRTTNQILKRKNMQLSSNSRKPRNNRYDKRF